MTALSEQRNSGTPCLIVPSIGISLSEDPSEKIVIDPLALIPAVGIQSDIDPSLIVITALDSPITKVDAQTRIIISPLVFDPAMITTESTPVNGINDKIYPFMTAMKRNIIPLAVDKIKITIAEPLFNDPQKAIIAPLVVNPSQLALNAPLKRVIIAPATATIDLLSPVAIDPSRLAVTYSEYYDRGRTVDEM